MLPISDGSGNLSDLAWAFIYAATAYPNDESAQVELLTVIIADITFQHQHLPDYDDLLLSAKPFLPGLLHARSRDEVFAAMGEAIGEGWVAGRLLIFLLRAAIHHPELRPNVTKGIDVISQAYRNARTAGGGHLFTSKRSLWDKWRAYKPMAHFHALIQLQFMVSEFEDGAPHAGDLVKLFMENMPEYLARAESFRVLAERCRFVAPGELWSAPPDIELPGVEFEPGPLSDEEQELLRNYRASTD